MKENAISDREESYIIAIYENFAIDQCPTRSNHEKNRELTKMYMHDITYAQHAIDECA